MKIDELNQYVWKRLGPRKIIAGRQTINDLIQLTVENWEQDAVEDARDDIELALVKDSMLQSVKRVHQACGDYGKTEYGFLWLILLQPLASVIIQLIIYWWFKSANNRKAMAAWKAEMTK